MTTPTIAARKSRTRRDAIKHLRMLEDAQHYATQARTVAGMTALGLAAAEIGASSIELHIDPGGSWCVFCDEYGDEIDPGEGWDAWSDVGVALDSIDPTYPGFRAVLDPGIDLPRTDSGDATGDTHAATLSVDTLIHGRPTDEADAATDPKHRADVLATWARAMHAAADAAQRDAETLHRHAHAPEA